MKCKNCGKEIILNQYYMKPKISKSDYGKYIHISTMSEWCNPMSYSTTYAEPEDVK